MLTINLLRDSLEDARKIKRRKYLEGWAVLLAFALVCGGIGISWMNAQQQIQFLQGELTVRETKVAARPHIEEKLKVLTERKRLLLDTLTQARHVHESREQPGKILHAVSGSVDPLSIWLVAIELTDDRVVLDGLAETREDVLGLLNALEEQSLFRHVAVTETRMKRIAEKPVISFIITLLRGMKNSDQIIS